VSLGVAWVAAVAHFFLPANLWVDEARPNTFGKISWWDPSGVLFPNQRSESMPLLTILGGEQHIVPNFGQLVFQGERLRKTELVFTITGRLADTKFSMRFSSEFRAFTVDHSAEAKIIKNKTGNGKFADRWALFYRFARL